MFWPRSVQSYAIKVVAMGITANFSALRAFIASESFLLVARGTGLAAYLMFLLLGIGIYKNG